MLGCILSFLLFAFVHIFLKQLSGKVLLGLGDAKLGALSVAWLGINGGAIALGLAFLLAGAF